MVVFFTFNFILSLVHGGDFVSDNKKAALSVVTVSFIVLIICSVFFIIANDITFTTGVYLNDGNNKMLIVDDEPIILNDSNETISKSIKTGNTLLVVHNGIMESYPPQINVKVAFKLGNKIVKDANYPVPEETILKNEDFNKEEANEWFAE